MNLKPKMLFLTVALVSAAGCSSPGTLIARQEGDALPKMGTAPVDGTFGLFVAGDSDELYKVILKKDAPLGFERGDAGVVRWLYAVAGPSRMPLDVAKTYEWRFLQ